MHGLCRWVDSLFHAIYRKRHCVLLASTTSTYMTAFRLTTWVCQLHTYALPSDLIHCLSAACMHYESSPVAAGCYNACEHHRSIVYSLTAIPELREVGVLWAPGRSQMSCALFNAAVDPEKAVGISAGTNPGSAVHENCAQLMKVRPWVSSPRSSDCCRGEGDYLLAFRGCQARFGPGHRFLLSHRT